MDTLGLPLRSGHSRRRSTHPRLLIIDDDPALLESLAEMLTIRLAQVHVETCSHPAFALSMVRRDDYRDDPVRCVHAGHRWISVVAHPT